MGGIYYSPPTQLANEVCTQATTETVIGTTSGVTLWSSGGNQYPVGEAVWRGYPLDADTFLAMQIPIRKNGGDPLQRPAGTPSQFERVVEASVVVTGSLTTTGDGSGTPIQSSFRVSGTNSDNAQIEMHNVQDVHVSPYLPAASGAFFDIVVTGDVELVQLTGAQNCAPPPQVVVVGPPPPVPIPPTVPPTIIPPPTTPPQQIQVVANEKNPGLSIDWGRDNRWPDIVTVNRLGIGVAYSHPRLTGSAGARLALLTGIKHHFAVVDDPPSFKVESDYTLDRIPDTNVSGDNLFFTFDDPDTGFDAGLIV